MNRRQQIYQVVKRIPRGRVASYGRIARKLGCGAREVGYAMAAAPDDVPWQRVLNSQGKISARREGGDGESRQRRKLTDEGVVFDNAGRVDFERFGWRERAAPRIVLTTGEPAGVGPDIVLRAADAFTARVVAVGDIDMLRARASTVQIEPYDETQDEVHDDRYDEVRDEVHDEVHGASTNPPGKLSVIHRPCKQKVVAGQLNEKNARYVLDCIDTAVDLCLASRFDAMTTAPVHKEIIHRAGFDFRGHTEWIAARCNAAAPVMMLANDNLRVCLLTTHLALGDVARNITATKLRDALDVIDAELRARFGVAEPTIGVCALNPHAGEGGLLGVEEIEIITPTLDDLRQRGMKLIGPLPADTAFTPQQLAQCDAVLAMYHDQGLPVIKARGFGETVNITLGLPIVRTSVDHGTALELAGGARADASSLIAAVDAAAKLARNDA